MRRVLPLTFLGWAVAGPALLNACAPVKQDPITAGDLAAYLPAFARLAPRTPIARAPEPGVRRVFRSSELLSLARNHSLELGAADDLCFEWPMQALDRGLVQDAMKTALPFPETRIEILETSLYPVPCGRIEFHREDLGAPASLGTTAPVSWRGSVVYGGNRSFTIWARVVVTARLPRVVAAEPIQRGRKITADEVRVEWMQVFPGPTDTAASVDQVIGRIAARNFAPGVEIRFNQVEPPQDVRPSETVAMANGLTPIGKS